jgi:hypothetical protein
MLSLCYLACSTNKLVILLDNNFACHLVLQKLHYWLVSLTWHDAHIWNAEHIGLHSLLYKFTGDPTIFCIWSILSSSINYPLCVAHYKFISRNILICIPFTISSGVLFCSRPKWSNCTWHMLVHIPSSLAFAIVTSIFGLHSLLCRCSHHNFILLSRCYKIYSLLLCCSCQFCTPWTCWFAWDSTVVSLLFHSNMLCYIGCWYAACTLCLLIVRITMILL